MAFTNYNTIAVLVEAGVPVYSSEYIQVTRQGEVIDHTGSNDAFYDYSTVSFSEIQIDGEVTSQYGGVVFKTYACYANVVSVASTGSISTATDAISMNVNGDYDNGVQNFGSIQSGYDAIVLSGVNGSVDNYGAIGARHNAIAFNGDTPSFGTYSLVFNSATGTISGDTCISDSYDLYLQNYGQILGGYGVVAGAASKITNAGAIAADFTGVKITGANGTLDNSGTIASNLDAAVIGVNNFSLQNSGVISSTDDDMTVSAGLNAVIVNSGTIRGEDDVVTLTSGASLIDNSGTIAATGTAAVNVDGGGLIVHNSGHITAKNATIKSSMAGATSWIVNQVGGVIAAGGLDDALVFALGPANVINRGEIDGSALLSASSALTNSGDFFGQANFAGLNASLKNSGDMSYGSNSSTVLFAGGAGSYDVLVNLSAGVIQSAFGFAFDDSGSGGQLLLTNYGEIIGFVASLATTTLTNAGIIDGRIALDSGSSLVINSGRIDDDVAFTGTGNIYRGQNGGISGTIHGAGADGRYYGGAGGETFDMTYNGAALVSGGAGDDTFLFTAGGLTAGTVVMGGAGDDALTFTTAASFGLHQFAHVSGVETYNLANGANTLNVTDAMVAAAGGALTINGGGQVDKISAAGVTGAAETVTISGSYGADVLTAGGGEDVFVYHYIVDSTGSGYDTIAGLNLSADRLDVSAAIKSSVLAINTPVTSGTLDSGANFNTELATAIGAAQLGAHDAVLFTASSGTLSGATFLIVDANGTGGYQANSDLVIRFTGATGTLTTSDFI